MKPSTKNSLNSYDYKKIVSKAVLMVGSLACVVLGYYAFAQEQVNAIIMEKLDPAIATIVVSILAYAVQRYKRDNTK